MGGEEEEQAEDEPEEDVEPTESSAAGTIREDEDDEDEEESAPDAPGYGRTELKDKSAAFQKVRNATNKMMLAGRFMKAANSLVEEGHMRLIKAAHERRQDSLDNREGLGKAILNAYDAIG